MTTTCSAYVCSPWQFELRDVELPPPPAGWALVRVEACGICGTDLTLAEAKAKEWQAFGHEVAGVIEGLVGPVDHLRVGDRVVLETSSFCGHCDLCRDGRVDLCAKAPNFWGGAAMGFSGHMLAPLACLVRYDGLTPEVACLTEPAGVALDLVKTAGITFGDRVAVVGPGPIGLMAARLAHHSGASRVVCVGRGHSTARLALAAELGAEAYPLNAALEAETDLAGQFDHVLLTAPAGQIPACMSLLAYGGVLSYVGIGAGGGDISFDAHDFHYRKLQLRASFASPAVYFPAVLRLLKAGVLPGEKFISHRFSLHDAGKAMTTCRDDKAGAVKIVVQP